MKKFKTKIFLSLLLAMFSFSSSFADCLYVFKGKIGKYPVVVSILATASSASGDYYYVSQGKRKTLQLSGECDVWGDQAVWYFTETVKGKWNGQFRVRWDPSSRNGYKRMTGIYRNVKGRTYKVNLTCVKSVVNPYHC